MDLLFSEDTGQDWKIKTRVMVTELILTTKKCEIWLVYSPQVGNNDTGIQFLQELSISNQTTSHIARATLHGTDILRKGPCPSLKEYGQRVSVRTGILPFKPRSTLKNKTLSVEGTRTRLISSSRTIYAEYLLQVFSPNGEKFLQKWKRSGIQVLYYYWRETKCIWNSSKHLMMKTLVPRKKNFIVMSFPGQC